MTYNILFLGSDDISKFIFENIILNPDINIFAVITKTSKKKKRGKKLLPTELKEAVDKENINREKKIKIYQIDKFTKEHDYLLDELSDKIDIILSISYGVYIPQKLIKLAKICAINIHPSYLPQLRGPSPIKTALLKGNKITGTSIIKIAKKMDSGDILDQDIVYINKDDNYQTLKDRLKISSLKIFNRFFNNLKIKGECKNYIKQDEKKVTYSKLFEKQDFKINFEKETSKEILNKIKAFSPLPGAYCIFRGKILKFLDAQETNIKIQNLQEDINFIEKQKQLYIIPKDNKLIKIKKLKIEGKKEVGALEFINGYKIKKEKLL